MKKFSFTINGNSYDCEIKNVEDNMAEVEVNGVSYSVELRDGIDYIHYPSVPVLQPPVILVSEHKVIPTHLVPSVVH